MNHPAKLTKPVADMSEDEFTDWLCSLPPPPGLAAATDDEFAADIVRARSDVAAGRVYSPAIVREWLMTSGLPGRKPLKEWLAARNG